jgi:hypothetical protein
MACDGFLRLVDQFSELLMKTATASLPGGQLRWSQCIHLTTLGEPRNSAKQFVHTDIHFADKQCRNDLLFLAEKLGFPPNATSLS